MLRIAFMFAALMVSTAAIAQKTDNAPVLPDASSDDEIIVQGLKIPRGKLPTSVYWSYPTVLANRIARENTDMFFRCALRASNMASLRQAVDGEPNSAKARTAQGLIILTQKGCYPPIRQIGGSVSTTAAIADLGNSILDRGVMMEKVLKTYAPDAALTPAIVADPAVRDRFKMRESFRNRLRLPVDRSALIFASCLVREQPVLATRLFRSEPGSLLERGLIQAILVEGRDCTDGGRRITVDPTLGRVYIIDAFYRWVVAARGVDSLIPADA